MDRIYRTVNIKNQATGKMRMCGSADVQMFKVVKCGCRCGYNPNFTHTHAVSAHPQVTVTVCTTIDEWFIQHCCVFSERSRSLYVVVRLSSVCNVGAPYSGD